MSNKREKKKMGFFDIIKNLFWLLIFLQFAPIVFSNLKKTVEESVAPKTKVGYMKVGNVIADSTFYVKNIKKYLKDPNIKALLLKIDSPGGLPGTAQTIFSEIKKFKEKKPVIAFIENIGASAAYNIAIACNHIVASPSALVGSIGVWLSVPPNIKDLAESWKIRFRTIKSGKFKTAGSPFKSMSPEERAYLQNVSDESYKQFVKTVASNRKLSPKNHEKWANGRIFTGNQALALKLIDQVGSESDAIEMLKKQAMIEGEVKLIQPRRPSRLMRLISSEEGADTETNLSSITANFIFDVISKISCKMNAI